MSSSHKKLSKFLSYILRHHPEEIGLQIDTRGWAHLASLIKKARDDGRSISEQQIQKMMTKSKKQRFSLSKDGQYIRAGYGHSINVKLELEPTSPPGILYHGTAQPNIFSIQKTGLKPQGCKWVHL